MAQSKYHGPRDDPKHLAVQEDITNLQDQINNFESVDGSICFEQILSNITNSNSITVYHPPTLCPVYCLYDKVDNCYVAATVVQGTAATDGSVSQVTVQFSSAPTSGRYCLTLSGQSVSAT